MFSKAGGQGKAGWLGVRCLNATSVVGQKGKQNQTLPVAGFISPKKRKKQEKKTTSRSAFTHQDPEEKVKRSQKKKVRA